MTLVNPRTVVLREKGGGGGRRRGAIVGSAALGPPLTNPERLSPPFTHEEVDFEKDRHLPETVRAETDPESKPSA